MSFFDNALNNVTAAITGSASQQSVAAAQHSQDLLNQQVIAEMQHEADLQNSPAVLAAKNKQILIYSIVGIIVVVILLKVFKVF